MRAGWSCSLGVRRRRAGHSGAMKQERAKMTDAERRGVDRRLNDFLVVLDRVAAEQRAYRDMAEQVARARYPEGHPGGRGPLFADLMEVREFVIQAIEAGGSDALARAFLSLEEIICC